MNPGYDFYMCLCYAAGASYKDAEIAWQKLPAEQQAVYAKAEEAFIKRMQIRNYRE